MIEELEAELATKTGDDRRPYRRRLRALRRGSGVPISRVRGEPRTRAGKAPPNRTVGESDADGRERHRLALLAANVLDGSSAPTPERGTMYPLHWFTEVILTKFEASYGGPPRYFDFWEMTSPVAESTTFVVLW